MTGIGLGEAALDQGRVRVELRAVNHRHLDVRVKTPPELGDAAGAIEEEVRSRCVRGRIEVSVRFESGESGAVTLDLERARATYRALLALRDELSPTQEVPVASLLSLPALFTSHLRLDAETLQTAAREAARSAVTDLQNMRAREGAALAEDLSTRLQSLRAHAAWVERQRPLVVDAARTKLQRRIEKLLEGTDVNLDPARLVQEVAWFAEKSDVAEELTRLESHCAQFAALIQGGGENLGKRLDFLTQEMGREVNTTGSKANDAAIAQRVVEMKAELERIREQVQNVL